MKVAASGIKSLVKKPPGFQGHSVSGLFVLLCLLREATLLKMIRILKSLEMAAGKCHFPLDIPGE